MAAYKGKGDRSIEESASLVGLRLPKQPTEETWLLKILGLWGGDCISDINVLSQLISSFGCNGLMQSF